jgi:hypothetical protein
MFVSYVLRMRPEEATPERFTAQVEAVGTGQRLIVHTVDELIGFLIDTVGDERAAAERARQRTDQ